MKYIALFFLLCPSLVFSGNLFLTAGGSYKTYSYDIVASEGKENYFKETLPSIKYSLIYATDDGTDDGLMLGFAGDNTLDANNLTVVNPNFSANTSADVNRNEYALYALYPIYDKIKLIAGFRHGVTDVNYSAGSTNEKDEIKTYGPYIGLQYKLYSGEKNSIQASIYYNKLNTDFSLFSEETDFKFNFEGLGYATSIGWLHNLSDDKFLQMSAEIHSYDHDDLKNSNRPVENFSIEETAYSVRLEYVHLFAK